MKSACTLEIGTKFTNGSDDIVWTITGKNEATRDMDNKVKKLDPSTCCYLVDIKKEETALNYKNELVSLTDMEFLVVNTLKEYSELEDCYTLHPSDISDFSGISIQKLRGVISSLDKKGVAYIDEIISGCGKWVVLFEN